VHRYLNVFPSKKSMLKAREAIRAKTGPNKCYKPTSAVVKDLNTDLKGSKKVKIVRISNCPDSGIFTPPLTVARTINRRKCGLSYVLKANSYQLFRVKFGLYVEKLLRCV